MHVRDIVIYGNSPQFRRIYQVLPGQQETRRFRTRSPGDRADPGEARTLPRFFPRRPWQQGGHCLTNFK